MDTRKEEIVEAFIQLVTRYGFDKTTMQDVAKEVGVSVGTIYNTFSNKEALIDAFHERMFREFNRFVGEVAASNQDVRDRLHDLLIGFVRGSNRVMRENRALLEIMRENRVIFKYIGTKMLNTRDQIRDNLKDSVQHILEQGVTEEVFDVRLVPETAELIVDALTEYWATPMTLSLPIEAIQEKAENMVVFIMRALRKSA